MEASKQEGRNSDAIIFVLSFWYLGLAWNGNTEYGTWITAQEYHFHWL